MDISFLTDTTVFKTVGDIIGPDIRFHPYYILPFIMIGFLVYCIKKKKADAEFRSFWGWLFPKDHYTHASTMLDVKLFALGRFLVLLKLINRLAVITFFAAVVMVLMGETPVTAPENFTLTQTALITLTITLVADFCVYWVHRIHHKRPVLWPFHAVHHSAEIMTPMTVYRKHPVYDFLSSIVAGFLMGITQGFIIAVLFGSVSVVSIAGINGIYFLFNFLGSNFRHSHIWISYGKILEHILISPAQHQIHHSLNPAHHDKNFGEIFAIWDWMFGTLYVPENEEILEYGIARPDGSGRRIKQPHNTMREALTAPFKDSYRALKKNKKHDA